MTRNPVVVPHATAGGMPLGSSGRGRLKLYKQPQGDTGYAVIEGSHPAGEPRIRDHVYARHEETFVVVAGEYRMRLGDEVIKARAGEYVFVPRGTAHTYCNVGPELARIASIMSPADGVELLVDLGAHTGGAVDEDV